MKIIKIKKNKAKKFSQNIEKKILENLPYKLTKNQKKILIELDNDIKSSFKMFRIIQGDVGSGKTILALILAAKICENNNYQVAYMAPTEILSKQQYYFAKQIFKSLNIKIEILTGSTKNKKEISQKLSSGEINIIIGTHALFQKNIKF